MKQRDIVDGGVYLTKVGGEMVEVRVREVRFAAPSNGRAKHTIKYHCIRRDDGRPLPSFRDFRALHPCE
jgi:hypothetical protein